MNNARKVLKRFVSDLQRPPLMTGKVVRVSGETCDVEPSDGGPVLYNVRIKPAINNSTFGVLALPKEGSPCIVGELDGNGNKYALVQAEQLDRLLLKTANGTAIELKADGNITLNGDALGGLVKVNELKQELNKVNSFLSTLRNAINSAPGGGDVVPFKSALSSALAPLQLPTYQTIENPKVKHGGA